MINYLYVQSVAVAQSRTCTNISNLCHGLNEEGIKRATGFWNSCNLNVCLSEALQVGSRALSLVGKGLLSLDRISFNLAAEVSTDYISYSFDNRSLIYNINHYTTWGHDNSKQEACQSVPNGKDRMWITCRRVAVAKWSKRSRIVTGAFLHAENVTK